MKIFKNLLKPETYEDFLDFRWYYEKTSGIRHFIRFMKRLPKYIHLCWHQEDWDWIYLLNLIEFKLEELYKAQKEDTFIADSDERAKEIKVVLGHLRKFYNIEDFTVDVDADEFLNNIYHEEITDGPHKGYYRMKTVDEELNKKHMEIFKHQDKLRELHYNKFFDKLKKYLRNWCI